MLKNHPPFLASELEPLPPDCCVFHIIPAPYEASVSYGGGTATGPGAILEASQQLEVWTGRADPSRHGIYTWPMVDCEGEAQHVLRNIEDAVARALQSGEEKSSLADKKQAQSGTPSNHALKSSVVPIVLGGEHTVSLGAFRALKAKYGSFGIVHFDAHADLRDSYEGSIYSHACVMRRAVSDLDLALFQVGVRSLSPEEAVFRTAMGISHLDAREAAFPLRGRLEEFLPCLLPENFPDRVYLSFDIDAFDASLMPATGTPEPGGLFWWDALHLIERSLAGRECIGADIVELAPIPEMHACDFTAARLVYEIMGLIRP